LQLHTAVRRILRDPDRKAIPRLLAEVLLLALRQREVPRHYASSLLYHRDSGPILAYATNRDIARINREVLLPQGRPTLLLYDKVWFGRFLQQHALPRVPVLAVLQDGALLRDGAAPVRGEAVRDALRQLSSQGPLFVKPIRGRQGRDCRPLDGPADVDTWLRAGQQDPMLIQPRLDQHPVLQALYATSVNTVRVQTCRRSPGPGGRVEVATGVLRVGARGSVVDNAAQGGLYAGLDLATGRLTTPFLTPFSRGGRRLPAHPESGVPAAEVVVPSLPEVLELVRAGHRWLPNQVVAWDVAVTPRGPVIIEANDLPPLHGIQAAARGLWSDPTYREVFAPQAGRRR
jgi:hypothetical protein